MAWATFETNGKFCVFALDADNNKKGESLECYPSREQAQTYVKGLYAREGKAEKALYELIETFKVGRRNAGVDQADIQTIHDLTCKLDAKCKEPERPIGEFDSVDKLAIFKDASGRYRWVLFSSSAFEDKDGEVVSQKALEDDAERMTRTGEYGPLRWHHIGKPDPKTKTAGPGVDFGDCDFSAMHGRISIESGTFRDEFFGERLKDVQEDLEVSRGFFHPLDAPDREGVFSSIHTFERSLLLKGKASNRLTRFFAFSNKEKVDMADMNWESVKEFINKLGGDGKAKEKVAGVLEVAETNEKSALAAGIRTKAEEPDGDEGDKKPAFLTEEMAKALINKAFGEYEAKMSAAKKESDEATVKSTNELTATLKAIQEGQTELKQAVVVALEGVAELNGTLPRRLGEQAKTWAASEKGKTPDPANEQLRNAMEAAKSSQEELKATQAGMGLNPADPLFKFTQAVMGGAQQAQQFINPNQPQG